jgi:hypothetical protein
LEAKIILEYRDPKTALAVARSVSPDNFSAPPSLRICTSNRNNQVLTEMKAEEKLSTLIATIDDFLFCVSTAEKTLQIINDKK